MGTSSANQLNVAALFAGIGGIELGLSATGHRTKLFCECLPEAQAVLEARFPDTPLMADVAELKDIPAVDLVTAGFPCQDLSQAGRTAGISGSQSSLVEHVFRILDTAKPSPQWILLENVPFMLSLERGQAMSWLTEQLDDRGFTWAYRVVDSRAFGLPQRRQRVLLLASKTADPRPILFNQDEGEPSDLDRTGLACGFYWTEGTRGLGFAIDAIPTLKGGSSLGIPSAPAIWQPGSGKIVTPDLRDAERLQGFPVGWTAPADGDRQSSRSSRWKLIGNAVSVPVATWLGERLTCGETLDPRIDDTGMTQGQRWPKAAWGRAGERRVVEVSAWPVSYARPHLQDFLEFEPRLLSERATAGFLRRAKASSLRIPKDLICDAEQHLATMALPIAA